MATKTKSAPNATEEMPFAVERDTSMLPEGTDVAVTQFVITLLPKLVPGQPRPRASEGTRTLIMIRDDEVPEASNPLIEAVKIANATTPRGMTSSVTPGRRMMRRIVEDDLNA